MYKLTELDIKLSRWGTVTVHRIMVHGPELAAGLPDPHPEWEDVVLRGESLIEHLNDDDLLEVDREIMREYRDDIASKEDMNYARYKDGAD
jgi:hypothetical protein